MPQDERRLERHGCSFMMRDEARRVISNRATGRNRSTVGEGVRGSREGFATRHFLRERFPVFLGIRVEFDLHGIAIDIIKINLNVK